MDIFLDEAGYTGPDLVKKDQPAFVLASTVLTELDARTLLDGCFGADREREVKHSRLSKTKRGRTQLLDFFQRVDRRKIGFFGVHKEYVLLAYLIDFWLEPLAHRDGVNLYERGANIALTNVSYVTLGATLGIEGRRELLRRFQVMQRDRTTFAYGSFWELVYDAVWKHRLIEKALAGLVVAERELGWDHLQALPADLLDLGDYGLLETVGFWRAEYPDAEFVLLHDTSKMIRRNRKRWEIVLDPGTPAPRWARIDARSSFHCRFAACIW